MYSRNLSAPAFAADFPPDAPKFNQRTLHVRLINLCTSDKKSSHKIRHSEIPRVHFIAYCITFFLLTEVCKMHKSTVQIVMGLESDAGALPRQTPPAAVHFA